MAGGLAAEVLAAARARGVTLATAESCTGGLIAATLTEVPGSSDVVDRGFITYSNAAKREMLGVTAATLDRHGAVSEGVVDAGCEATVTARVEVTHAEVLADRLHLGVGRVVDDRDGQVRERGEALAHEVGSVVGHDDDLRRAGGRIRTARRHVLVQLHVVPADHVPVELARSRDPLRAHCG